VEHLRQVHQQVRRRAQRAQLLERLVPCTSKQQMNEPEPSIDLDQPASTHSNPTQQPSNYYDVPMMKGMALQPWYLTAGRGGSPPFSSVSTSMLISFRDASSSSSRPPPRILAPCDSPPSPFPGRQGSVSAGACVSVMRGSLLFIIKQDAGSFPCPKQCSANQSVTGPFPLHHPY
jgi:hypothetical protein